jgi:hypothetical protein
LTAVFDEIGRVSGVVLVTVTYGDRLRYLLQLLDRAIGDEGVYRAVVVNNAAVSDLSQLKAELGGRVSVIDLESNTGSANGYAVGIRAALILGAEYLWLMDDDNAPAAGALGVLRHELSRLAVEIGIDRAAVQGFRSSRMKLAGDPTLNFVLPSSFIGFHARQIPQKLSRLVGRRAPGGGTRGRFADVPYAPYGGFLAHRLVFERLGLPRTDLVLYADDWEYTMRLTKMGGRIRLVFDAAIEDLESSWNQEPRKPNIFLQSLVLGSDVQVYYTFRNHAWLNLNRQSASQFVYRVNRFLFLTMLALYAVTLRRGRRLGVILRAVADGERGCLGISPEYPLD